MRTALVFAAAISLITLAISARAQYLPEEFQQYELSERDQFCRAVHETPGACANSPALKPFQAVLQSQTALCKEQYQKNECQALEGKPEAQGKLLKCDDPVSLCKSMSDGFGKCLDEKYRFGKSVVEALLNAAAKLPDKIDKSPEALQKGLQALNESVIQHLARMASCNDNKDGEKDQIIEAFHIQLYPELAEKWKVADDKREAHLEKTCAQLERDLKARLRMHDQEYMEKLRSGQIKLSPEEIQQRVDVLQLVKDLAKEINAKAFCHDSAYKGEILCNGSILIARIMVGGPLSAAATRGLTVLVSRGVLSPTLQSRMLVVLEQRLPGDVLKSSKQAVGAAKNAKAAAGSGSGSAIQMPAPAPMAELPAPGRLAPLSPQNLQPIEKSKALTVLPKWKVSDFPELQTTISIAKGRTKVSQWAQNKVTSVTEIDWKKTASGFVQPDALAKLGSRAATLEPKIQRTIVGIHNKMNDRAAFERYVDQLTEDTVAEIQKRGIQKEIDELKEGNLSRNAVLRVLVQRAKDRGEGDISTVVKKKEGAESTKTKKYSDNSGFREAVSQGPFFDKPLVKSRHGVDMHFIQKDYIADVVKDSMGGASKEFWNFLGSKQGINYWVPLFDASDSGAKSLASPEFFRHQINGYMPLK